MYTTVHTIILTLCLLIQENDRNKSNDSKKCLWVFAMKADYLAVFTDIKNRPTAFLITAWLECCQLKHHVSLAGD